MISRHQYSLEILGTGARPALLDGNVTIDETNLPFIKAGARIAIPDAATLAALHPSKGARVRLSMRQTFGLSETLGDISRDFGNMIPNGSFETNLDGFSVVNGTITRDETRYEHGNASMKFVSAGGTRGYVNAGSFTVQPATQYTFSTRMLVEEDLSVPYSILVEFYSNFDDWGYLGEVVGTEIQEATDGWATAVNTFTVPEGATGIVLYVIIGQSGSSPVAGDTVWLDAVQLNRGAEVPAFNGNDGTLASLSASFENLTGLTNTYGVEPWNDFGFRASTSRRFNLGVRTAAVDYASGTVDLTLESDEALLGDMCLVDSVAAQPLTNTVRGAVEMVLRAIGTTLTPGTDDAPLEADAVAWRPGESAWDYINPLVTAAGLRLWCDERRKWHLTQPLAPTEGALRLSGDNSYYLDDELSRDTDWFDAVHVTYRWRDSSDVERVRYDFDSVPGYSRVYSVEYERPYPGPGAAAAMLNRTRARGRVDTVTTTSDYSAFPGATLIVELPDGSIQTGLVSNVEWSLSTDQMTVRSRELVDTPENAWLLAPEGLAWNEVPAGTDWTEFVVETEGI